MKHLARLESDRGGEFWERKSKENGGVCKRGKRMFTPLGYPPVLELAAPWF